MGERFKLGILAIAFSLSGGATVEHKDGEDRREHTIPAKVWSEQGESEFHLMVTSPGTRSSKVSKVGLVLSVSSLMSGIPLAAPISAFYVAAQLFSYDIVWPGPMYLLENKETLQKEDLRVKVPYLDFFHLRQVMVGRRNRIEHQGQMVKAVPLEAQLQIEENRLVHVAFDMAFTATGRGGEKTTETKMVALHDIHFQGPAGSIGLCKTALTALGVLR